MDMLKSRLVSLIRGGADRSFVAKAVTGFLGDDIFLTMTGDPSTGRDA